MKKTIVLFFALAAAALSLSTCQTLGSVFHEPVLSLHSVELSNISFNGVTLLCKVNVENPNAFTIPFPDIDWEFFVNQHSFIRGKINAGQSLKSRRTTVVDVPVSVDYLEFFNSFASLKGSKQADYKVALAAKFAIPYIGDKVWHFDHEGTFPVIQLPKITAPSIKMDNVDFTKAEMLFTVNVENPNAFELPGLDMAYDYLVNRNSFIKSSLETSAPLAAAAITAVTIRFTVDYLELYRTFQTLRNSNEAPSSFSLKSTFKIPAFAGESNSLELPGSLPLLKTPSVSFAGISVKNSLPTNLQTGRIDVEIAWEVENNNNFPMSINDFSYDLKVNNSRWGSGKVPNAPQLLAGRKTRIPLTISLNVSSVGNDIIEIIRKGTNVNYACTGNVSIGASPMGLNNLNFGSPFDFSGTTKF